MAPKGKGKGKEKANGNGNENENGNGIVKSNGVVSEEVMANILSRLPVKSLLRFRCVSKEWRTLTSAPRFLSRHLSRSPPSILILAETPDRLRERGVPPDHVMYKYGPRSHPVSRIRRFPCSYEIDIYSRHYLDVIRCPNGVVCVVQYPECRDFILWNPATGSTLHLPDPTLRYNRNYNRQAYAGVEFDSAHDDYNVIRVLSRPGHLSDLVEVLSVRRRGQWRVLTQKKKLALNHICSTVANGVPYWRSVKLDPPTQDGASKRFREKLTWFDGCANAFRVEEFPWHTELHEWCTGVINERLCAVTWDTKTKVLEVWMKKGEGRGRAGWDSKQYEMVGPSGMVVGFYGEGRILIDVAEDGPQKLIVFDLEKMETVDELSVEEGMQGTFRLLDWKESLTELPILGDLK